MIELPACQPNRIANDVMTAHAAFEMARRGISKEMVNNVMIAPEQRLLVRTGRVVLQSRVSEARKVEFQMAE
jgi:hypothetical protein